MQKKICAFCLNEIDQLGSYVATQGVFYHLEYVNEDGTKVLCFREYELALLQEFRIYYMRRAGL